ncbi:MAG: glycosyltransferase family 2 protein [Roseicyclus sp.]
MQVCVHNSPEDVARCLASVQAALGPDERLLIVDDGSDPPARDVCEEAARHPRTRLIRRAQASGFTRAADAGLRARAEARVVVLNSDTVVTPGWLDRLAAPFDLGDEVGLVGPLSNAGGWQSIPESARCGPAQNAIRDDDATLAEIAAFCAGFRTCFDLPLVDQLNGFCFALRADVLTRIGHLDEARFPRGHDEEVDFMFRASAAGILAAVAIDRFVYHARSRSFSTKARSENIRAGRHQLLSLYGAARLERATRSTQHHPVLAAIRAEAREAFAANGWLAGNGRAAPPGLDGHSSGN